MATTSLAGSRFEARHCDLQETAGGARVISADLNRCVPLGVKSGRTDTAAGNHERNVGAHSPRQKIIRAAGSSHIFDDRPA